MKPIPFLVAFALLSAPAARADADLDDVPRGVFVQAGASWDAGVRAGELSLVYGLSDEGNVLGAGPLARTWGVEGGGRAMAYGALAQGVFRANEWLRAVVRTSVFYAPLANAPWDGAEATLASAAGAWWSYGLGFMLAYEFDDAEDRALGLVFVTDFVPGPLEGGLTALVAASF